jgi:hypothetical protein
MDQCALDPAKLVFIDETGCATNMARQRGRAPKGQRVKGRVPSIERLRSMHLVCYRAEPATAMRNPE